MKLNLWKRATIEIEVINRICGGIPTDPNLIEGWVKANMPAATEEERKALAEKTVAELGDAVEEKAGGMWTTFKRNGQGQLYIEGRQVKAMLKESANILRELLIKAEEKGKEGTGKSKNRYTNLKSKVAERFFIEQDHIFPTKNGEQLTKPDGTEEKAIHVITAQGPRSALKRVDYIEAPKLKFTCRWINDGIVDEGLLATLLEHASYNGVGSDRSQGNGRFTFRVVKIEDVEK